MKSRIYEGQVRHRRFSPRTHSFSYRLYMMYLDLEELPTLFDRFWLWSSTKRNVASFCRGDHMGAPDQNLIDTVREKIYEHTGTRTNGPIRLLTHCRYFGIGFNPVSFYYCFDEDDTHVDHIIAEVNNTPWGEQHCYVLCRSTDISLTDTHHRYTPRKEFHVSPFMPMDIDYDWRFIDPGQRLTVHMANHIDAVKIFDAALDLEEREISSWNLASMLIRFPFMTLKVVAGIYFEATRLFLKRVPFFDHPSLNQTEIETRES